MIDYILDNMIVNKYQQHGRARKLRSEGSFMYTICEEIAYEQRLAPDSERDAIKHEAKTLSEVVDFKLLTDIANEMVDHGVLDLDEGGGDVMIAYDVSSSVPNLFISERVVVSEDNGVRGFCERHDFRVINDAEYASVIQSS